MNLSDSQIERYSRHIILREVGPEGQERISGSSVLIVGAGGLGSAAALYLAAAGTGTIGLIDGDTVEMTNLQRQVIHFTADLGKPKVESAAEKIRALNPHVKIDIYNELLDAGNISGIAGKYDFIIDGTDNFPAKFLINDACVMGGKAFSHGGVLRFDGQTMTHTPGNACYRCIFESPPPENMVPSCSQAGILGSIAGMLGTIQATEALKYIAGIGELLTNRLLTFDALGMKFAEIGFSKNKNCPVCGENPVITELIAGGQPACD
jgi:molybdopterin-synthase adenylyltransferase